MEQLQVDWRVRFFGAGKAVQALAGSIRSNKGATSTNLSAQINGNSYDINKLQKTQPYTYAENVSSIKETIAQNGPNAVPPIEIRVHNEQVLVVDGHHRLEAFRQLGYDRVPIKYLHSSQLGKTFPNGTYYRSIQELLDTIDIKS
ncbi:ParB/RepB/Spo0J family partition protein [Lachnospiraceae bacterium 64-25]